jgi:3-oxoacyl-[acyl-carrier-protein] synthase II
MSADPIVVTGLGLVTPIGTGKIEFWEALLRGENGVRPIRSLDTSLYRTHRGGEVQNFSPEPYFKNSNPQSVGRCAHLAVSASRLALEDSGIDFEDVTPARAGVVCGTTMGESPTAEKLDTCLASGDMQAARAVDMLQFPSEMVPIAVAREFNWSGPASIMSTACAASNYAIGYAADLLRMGVVDLMVAGGSDPLSRVVFTGFNSMLAVAPERCQPFDLHRKGMCVSEGAAMLVLERASGARRRGAPIYAEVVSYGTSNDAYHMTAPHPQARGAVRAVQQAFREGQVSADSIDYISAHGTGTPANDKIETMAMKRVFGDAAYSIPMSSIKSMLGHTMGAAGAIEAVASILAIQNSVLPPTINYCEADPECDLDYVPNCAREKKVRTVLSNSFAFGGNCAALVLREYSSNGK